MTREEAIEFLLRFRKDRNGELREVVNMAIEALKVEPQKSYPTEWCEQCDLWEDNKCVGAAQCRSNIEALKQVTSEDLISRAEAIEAITETLDAIDHVPKWVFDKLTSAIEILPPTDRSTDGDLISRAEAIDAIELVDWYHQNKNKDMVHGANDDEHQAWYKADDVYKALEAIPSADKQRNGDLISRAEAIRAITEYNEMPTENCYHEYNHGYKNGMNMAVHFLENIPSADRPRGEWEEMGENKDGTHNIRCNQCGESFKAKGHANSHNTKKKYRFCPSCGADMRGE